MPGGGLNKQRYKKRRGPDVGVTLRAVTETDGAGTPGNQPRGLKAEREKKRAPLWERCRHARWARPLRQKGVKPVGAARGQANRQFNRATSANYLLEPARSATSDEGSDMADRGTDPKEKIP